MNPAHYILASASWAGASAPGYGLDRMNLLLPGAIVLGLLGRDPFERQGKSKARKTRFGLKDSQT